MATLCVSRKNSDNTFFSISIHCIANNLTVIFYTIIILANFNCLFFFNKYFPWSFIIVVVVVVAVVVNELVEDKSYKTTKL